MMTYSTIFLYGGGPPLWHEGIKKANMLDRW